MDGSERVIMSLNRLLYNELTTINQYFLHAKMIESWGYKKLADAEYQESLEEMRHADRLVKRILVLQGLPNLQDIGRLRIGESVQEVLSCDLNMELENRQDLRDAIAECEAERDYVSRDLCQSILVEEEKHIDWLEIQLQIIEDIGEMNYLQSQVGSGEPD